MAEKANRPMKVLVVNPFGIGDVLFSMYVMEALAQARPSTSFGFVCNERTIDLVKANIRVRETFVFNRDALRSSWRQNPWATIQDMRTWLQQIRNHRYDVALDFSMGREYSFLLMLAGIRKRIGLNYRNRGFFLTGRALFKGYGARHVVESQLRTLDFLGIPNSQLKAIQRPQFKSQTKAVLPGYPQENFVLVVVPGGGRSWGANASYKQWPADRFVEASQTILRQIKSRPHEIVVLGDDSELELVSQVSHLLGPHTQALVNKPMTEVMAWLERADLVLANDGGMFHLATVLGRPTVGIYGPVDPAVYGPYGEEHRARVVTEPVECRPCYQDFRFPPCGHDKQCLKNLSVQKVVDAAMSLL